MQINPTTFAPARFANLASIANLIIPILMVGAAIIFLVMVIRAAFSYLMASGNPENIKKAQKALSFAVVGLVLVILAYTIIKVIAFVFNISLFF
ncbi:hypothetical protein M1523_02650 [Patescibacteria group bacterium]|nr:hypothetical protein [Patescibacteria group bacterium]MCL5091379.1 hypothetical protein [Patescibacteria group bacterium]